MFLAIASFFENVLWDRYRRNIFRDFDRGWK
jgi:hypothetical protein